MQAFSLEDSRELIIVEQLPVITERLKIVSDEIDRKTSAAMALECTDDTVKQVKKLRADLNIDFTGWEERRKTVKTSIMAPYEAFEGAYKRFISDKYKDADRTLKARISAVEEDLKQQKTIELQSYFDEYAASVRIDFVTLANARINVTLSASLKSLKAQAKEFIDRICDDIRLIETQDHRDEILVEYYKSLNCSDAITAVVTRHKMLAAQEERRRELEQHKAEEQAAIEKVNNAVQIAPPVEVSTLEGDPIKTLVFKVTAPLSKLRALKEFLVNGGYDYE